MSPLELVALSVPDTLICENSISPDAVFAETLSILHLETFIVPDEVVTETSPHLQSLQKTSPELLTEILDKHPEVEFVQIQLKLPAVIVRVSYSCSGKKT